MGKAIVVHVDCGGRVLPAYRGAISFECAECGQHVRWPHPDESPVLDGRTEGRGDLEVERRG